MLARHIGTHRRPLFSTSVVSVARKAPQCRDNVTVFSLGLGQRGGHRIVIIQGSGKALKAGFSHFS